MPDPGDYDSALWTAAGFPGGPATYADLLEGDNDVIVIGKLDPGLGQGVVMQRAALLFVIVGAVVISAGIGQAVYRRVNGGKKAGIQREAWGRP